MDEQSPVLRGVQPREQLFPEHRICRARLPKADELLLLAPLKAEVPPEVFTTVFQPPASKGDGYDRDNLLKASKLLDEAGWQLKNQKRVNAKTGKPLSFELLLSSGGNDQWVLPFKHNLARLGITMNIRRSITRRSPTACAAAITT